MSGAFSVRLSFFTSSGCAAGSRKGVPSGEVTRLEGEVIGRSLGFFGMDAGLVLLARWTAKGSPRAPESRRALSWSCQEELSPGLRRDRSNHREQAPEKRFPCALPLSGVCAGLADAPGAAVALGLAGAAGLAPVSGCGRR